MSLDEEKAVYTFIGKVTMAQEILNRAIEQGTISYTYNPINIALQSGLEQIKFALNHE